MSELRIFCNFFLTPSSSRLERKLSDNHYNHQLGYIQSELIVVGKKTKTLQAPTGTTSEKPRYRGVDSFRFTFEPRNTDKCKTRTMKGNKKAPLKTNNCSIQ